MTLGIRTLYKAVPVRAAFTWDGTVLPQSSMCITVYANGVEVKTMKVVIAS